MDASRMITISFLIIIIIIIIIIINKLVSRVLGYGTKIIIIIIVPRGRPRRSTTECAADEVSFEDAWGKKEAGGPDWFLCDDNNIWPPDGG